MCWGSATSSRTCGCTGRCCGRLGRGRPARGDGQLMRIALVPVGHLFGRLPVGNTGGANVSAFKPMAIPPELERLIEDRDR